jgi:hypothetical protein
VKVDTIAEREHFMSKSELANVEYFPRYIGVRRPANNKSERVQEEW